MKNILIIKTGHSETFAESTASSICSLGDVLRTIPIILSHFETSSSNISWLTDHKAFGLFNLFQKDIKLYDESKNNISFEEYDLIVNLEKGFSIRSEKVFGFTSQNTLKSLVTGKEKSYSFPILDETTIEDKFFTYLNISMNKRNVELNKKFMVQEEFDVGLNWKSGEKWPEKEIEKKYWERWNQSLSESMNVSWQEGFNNLEEYILWIARSRAIITLDSLGLHIARVLGKKIVSLYGPTNCENYNSNGREKFLFYRDLNEKEKLNKKILEVIKFEE